MPLRKSNNNQSKQPTAELTQTKWQNYAQVKEKCLQPIQVI